MALKSPSSLGSCQCNLWSGARLPNEPAREGDPDRVCLQRTPQVPQSDDNCSTFLLQECFIRLLNQCHFSSARFRILPPPPPPPLECIKINLGAWRRDGIFPTHGGRSIPAGLGGFLTNELEHCQMSACQVIYESAFLMRSLQGNHKTAH